MDQPTHLPRAAFSVASWNINSLRSRLHHLLEFLDQQRPHIVLLQETKCENHAFPQETIEDMGYNLAVWGQKTYNGVAILSKTPLEEICCGLDGWDDEQARYVEAATTIAGHYLRVASIYVPNGQSPESEKFTYKLAFMDALNRHADRLLAQEEMLILGGDYNIATDAIDVYDPAALEDTVCYHPQERRALRTLLHQGFYDAFRSMHPKQQEFSWWDYRGGSFDRNLGLRIDHLLLSPEAADRLVECEIVRQERAKDRPSDHAPVIAHFSIPSCS